MKVPVQDIRKMKVQTALLRFLYAGGVLAVGITAPKLLRFIGSPDRSQPRRKALYARIDLARNRLKQRGLVSEKEAGGRTHFELTAEGIRTIEKILVRDYQVPEPVRWDGKWRILAFDISERRKNVRTRLRHLLSGAGFVRIQDSLWVHPYPCDEFVALIRAHLASGTGELRAFVADALESDRALREHFGLVL